MADAASWLRQKPFDLKLRRRKITQSQIDMIDIDSLYAPLP